jgi:hypothetical protein
MPLHQTEIGWAVDARPPAKKNLTGLHPPLDLIARRRG